jgi:hypothetical protein
LRVGCRGRGRRCGAELDKVGLVFLVAGRNEAMDLALQLDFLFVRIRRVPSR